MSATEYFPDGLQRDLIAVVGDAGARQYRRLRRVDATFLWFSVLSGLLLGLGIASGHRWMWILASSLFAAGFLASLLVHIPLARTLAPRVGRSAWWCGNHILVQPVLFVESIDAQIAAKSGEHKLGGDPNRDAAIENAKKVSAAARSLQRSAIKLQAAAVLATAGPLLAPLVHGEQPPPQLLPPSLQSIPNVSTTPPDPATSAPPTAPVGHGTPCGRLVQLAPVEASFGYVPGSRPTTQTIAGIPLPAATPVTKCLLDQSADPAVGSSKTIAYLYSGVTQSAYIRRLLAAGWQDGGADTYTDFPGGRSLQVDLIAVGKRLVVLTQDNTP